MERKIANRMPLDAKGYINSCPFQKGEYPGGQELILSEIIATLDGLLNIWLPFPEYCAVLSSQLTQRGFTVSEISYLPNFYAPSSLDAIYFGTPTIVNNSSLFSEKLLLDKWNIRSERMIVRKLVQVAIERGCKKIICGLGSGDISPKQRIQDIGGGKIICFKDFGDFQDWVIERDLPYAK